MKTPLGPALLRRRYLRHGMLPQLAAFEAVVRLGSATRAAETLCIAQPTLSGHLRKLSEALGVPLFEVHSKRLVPTDAARVLLHAVHDVFAALEGCEQVLAGLRASSDMNPCARVPIEAEAPRLACAVA
jgi:DNA-binding transcriptional LysR family regulator